MRAIKDGAAQARLGHARIAVTGKAADSGCVGKVEIARRREAPREHLSHPDERLT